MGELMGDKMTVRYERVEPCKHGEWNPHSTDDPEVAKRFVGDGTIRICKGGTRTNLYGAKHLWCARHEQVARDGEPTCLDGELDDRNWQGCVLVPSVVIPLYDHDDD